jgi:hypothetical protein
MGVARSTVDDSRIAGATAAREALTGPDPKLLIVFFAICHDPGAVLDGVRDVAGDVPVVGCSTHGEIAPGGPTDGTVVVTAIGGPGLAVSTAVAEHVAGRQREAGAEIAACVAEAPDLSYKVLMLLTDGKIRDQETILRGCYGVLGASIPFIGGAAGWRRATCRPGSTSRAGPSAARARSTTAASPGR